MSSKSTIETPRLLLRIDTLEDYNRIFESFDDKALMQYFGYINEAELESEKLKVKGGLCTYRTSVVFFHLIEKTTHTVLGSFAFHNWFKIHSRSEIGYALKKDEYKNRGFMKEAIVPILDYGFHILKINRMEAFIGPDNIASQKVVLGQGFKQEGVLKEHYNKDGDLQDSILFALLRKDYKF
jgi:ribosomal-protein-alanine N-acetyltransferase